MPSSPAAKAPRRPLPALPPADATTGPESPQQDTQPDIGRMEETETTAADSTVADTAAHAVAIDASTTEEDAASEPVPDPAPQAAENDITDGLALSCLAVIADPPPPPVPVRTDNDVANVRAAHILPNVSALRPHPPATASTTATADVSVTSNGVRGADIRIPVSSGNNSTNILEEEEGLPKYKRDLVAKMKVRSIALF